MRVKIFCAICLFVIGALGVSLAPAVPPQEDEKEKQPKSQKFGALAYMPSGAGPAMVGAGAKANIDIYVKSYTNDAEAKAMAAALIEGGPDALLKQLEKAKSIGKITLTGRVGFYDLKLIRSHKIEGGRRIYAVGDRPVGFLEAYVNNRSRDYPFGILQLDLKTNSKGKEEGEGALIYAAKIKVLKNNTIDVESYGIDPIRLLGVRKL
ncbi:MAG: hypothetical protein C5B55_07610 [Blastocatellia bacterium]|nr:MAG: hypothetical protein C5B55_07610 [Blastocatellia bacterium]